MDKLKIYREKYEWKWIFLFNKLAPIFWSAEKMINIVEYEEVFQNLECFKQHLIDIAPNISEDEHPKWILKKSVTARGISPIRKKNSAIANFNDFFKTNKNIYKFGIIKLYHDNLKLH